MDIPSEKREIFELLLHPRYKELSQKGKDLGKLFISHGLPPEIAIESKPELFNLVSSQDRACLLLGILNAITENKFNSGITYKRLRYMHDKNTEKILRVLKTNVIEFI